MLSVKEDQHFLKHFFLVFLIDLKTLCCHCRYSLLTAEKATNQWAICTNRRRVQNGDLVNYLLFRVHYISLREAHRQLGLEASTSGLSNPRQSTQQGEQRDISSPLTGSQWMCLQCGHQSHRWPNGIGFDRFMFSVSFFLSYAVTAAAIVCFDYQILFWFNQKNNNDNVLKWFIFKKMQQIFILLNIFMYI